MRPRIFSGPASKYAMRGEIIREFGQSPNVLNGAGGLISIRQVDDEEGNAKLIVDLYRLTNVEVRVNPSHLANHPGGTE